VKAHVLGKLYILGKDFISSRMLWCWLCAPNGLGRGKDSLPADK